MVVWNSGSVANHVGNMVGWSNIGDISGTTLNTMVVQEVNFVNTLTNDGIDPNSIAEKYQPSIIDLTMSKVLLALDAQDGGITSASLGELSVSQAGEGGNSEVAKQLREDAIQRLRELGRYIRYARIIAG